MKINILIITWINRLLMFVLVFSLLTGFFSDDSFFIGLCTAFILGIFQVSSFLMTLFYLKYIGKEFRNLMKCYFPLVILYFSLAYILINFCEVYFNKVLLISILYSIPVLLSFFWTYILESINKKI